MSDSEQPLPVDAPLMVANPGLSTSNRIMLSQQRAMHTIHVVDEPRLGDRARLAAYQGLDAEVVVKLLGTARRVFSESLSPTSPFDPPAWVRRGLAVEGWTAWRFDHLGHLRALDGGPLVPDPDEEDEDGSGE